MPKEKSFTVEEQSRGQRLDVFLFKEGFSLSRSKIKKLIEAGLVTVDGRVEKPSFFLKTGQTVKARESETLRQDLASQKIPVDIIYEDTELIVVDKPQGMVVHPAPGHSTGTLVNALLAKIKDLKPIMGELRPGIVHRLDKDTSGVMVVAKDENSLTDLARQFKERAVNKVYLALALGQFLKGEFFSDKSISRSRSDGKRMSAGAQEGRDAVTYFKVLERFKGAALLEARPKTGRTHQIRVHLANLGHPIVGDRLYLKKKMTDAVKSRSLRRALEDFPRQALHALSIEFTHPKTGKRLRFEAPIPQDMTTLLDFLRK